MAEADPRNRFDLHEVAADFARLADRAHAGEEIVVEKAGIPYARLVPVDPSPRRRRMPGGWPELAAIPMSAWLEPLPDEELDFIDDRPEAERR